MKAVVQIEYIRLLCPSVELGTQLVKMLAKTTRVRGTFSEGKERLVANSDDGEAGLRVELELVESDRIQRRIPKARRLTEGTSSEEKA